MTIRRLVAAVLSILVTATSAHAASCGFESHEDGHVTEMIDGRSFRLSEGREIRLAGIERVAPRYAGALSALVKDKDVNLHGPDDTPDRSGRQIAFVFLAGSDVSV